MLGDLQNELRKLGPVSLANDTFSTLEIEDITTWLAEKLGLVSSEPAEALRIVQGTSTLTKPDQVAFIDVHLSAFLVPNDLATLASVSERLIYVYRQLLAFLSENIAVQRLAAAVGLDVGTTKALLGTHLSVPSDPSRPAIDAFLSGAFVSQDTTDPTAVPDAYAVMIQLAKLRLVIDRLGFTTDDLDFVLTRGAALGWYDLRTIPVVSLGQEAVDIASWMRLLRAQALNRTHFSDPASLYQLLASVEQPEAQREAILTAVAEQTGWNWASLDFLTSADGYDFAFPGDFLDERWLARLNDAFDLIAKAGVSGAELWDWNSVDASESLARRIKNAAKARHSNQQWLTLVPPLTDRLRALRRNALVDYLVAEHTGINDADDLYERLLIDPSVEPCFLTSRIKQAISSVQLFVHRVFLGLENQVRFSREDAEEWIWRKNYRVWEAARQVFLYPENYAEPELRVDKSPLFQELEDNLLQAEVTDATVESAYLRYLRGLDEVARLNIVGLCIEESPHVVHIFARTQATPPVYYYRRHVDNAYFTPWEKVEVNIEGDHILPMVYNRRLWLLWLVFTKKDRRKSSNLDNAENPIHHYEIKVSWSEYRDGQWSSPRTSSRAISTRVTRHQNESDSYQFRYDRKGRYYFRAQISNGNLEIYPFFHRKDNPDALHQPFQHFSFQSNNDDPLVYYRLPQNLENSGYFGVNIEDMVPYRVPESTFSTAMKFQAKPGVKDVKLYSKISTLWHTGVIDIGESEVSHILDNAPSRFFLTPPHQYLLYYSQAPFFYEDHARTFFVIPKNVIESGPSEAAFFKKDQGNLSTLGIMRTMYLPTGSRTEPEPYVQLLEEDSPSETTVFTARSGFLALDRNAKTVSQPFERDLEDTSDAFAVAEPSAPVAAGAPWETLEEAGSAETTKKYRFITFYHPYTDLFIRQLNRFGVDGLLRPGPTGAGKALHRQLTPDSDFIFTSYGPRSGMVQSPHPTEEIDFREGGSYCEYNWEVFFHIPMLIANRLSQNQRFEEAQRWYHYIFDPTETDETGLEADETHRRFWKIKPFFEFSKATSIQEIVTLINQGSATDVDQVSRWEDDPFNPHLLARHRVVSYMKLVVMKYLDNLIAWADNLFRLGTLETINQATQLYVLAANMLGRRPVQTPGREAAARTFDDLRNNLDALSNALVTLENQLKWSPPFKATRLFEAYEGIAGKSVYRDSSNFQLKAGSNAGRSAALQFGGAFSFARTMTEPEIDNPLVLYFCIPNNDKLLEYFDVLSDRLFKIRNCMNIEGLRRTLDLFEPPIDPALLVKAAAAGVDLSSALDDLNAPLPHYRFTYVLQKAMSLCQEVKSLGGALLSALEKKDAENLAVLRASNQVDILKSTRALKHLSIEEMKENLSGLEATKATIQHRIDFYASREFKNPSERHQEGNLDLANMFQLFSQGYDLAANIAYLIPQFKGGVQGIRVKLRVYCCHHFNGFKLLIQTLT